MDQRIESKQHDDQPDIGSCRVCRMADGIEVCMMNRSCAYALPFGNVCSHPMVALMAHIETCVK